MEQVDQGRFRVRHIFNSVCFSFFFSVFVLNYFILVIWNYKNCKYFHSFMFFIELCKKNVGVGVKDH